ncbi:hypothetical protein BTR14_18755 [Rhizobium rhizosphaerae]|uniref:Polyketide cyclase n=1 Tax=Xaviernesmea rhizosphaerae TaxID=1672749 RepID=A0ABX3PAH7_9HYPH|nr:SRPBCC domain-containing protein [Xaviernesmea rhizosphaerae]OQP84662.1 hypothetical protein BTR14_18755 [Xaviernesmea rhizosphaerae]
MTEDTPVDAALLFEETLDAPLPKVWRALSIPALRAQWLPSGDLIEPGGVEVVPGQAMRYRMRERTPPFLESQVTIRLTPGEDGGTHIRILHELARPRAACPVAANANRAPLLSAA